MLSPAVAAAEPGTHGGIPGATETTEGRAGMENYDLAEFAAINARAYREYMARHPESRITLTREQWDASLLSSPRKEATMVSDRDYPTEVLRALNAKDDELVRLRSALDIARGRVAGMPASTANLILAAQHILHVIDSDAPSEVWYEACDRLQDALHDAAGETGSPYEGATP